MFHEKKQDLTKGLYIALNIDFFISLELFESICGERLLFACGFLLSLHCIRSRNFQKFNQHVVLAWVNQDS